MVRGTSEDGASVSMFDLLKAALRQRPNAILVGEIRGEEGNIAFQAMQTGHMVMATFHAASVEKLIQRITGNPINVPKTYMDNLNVVVIISAVKLPMARARGASSRSTSSSATTTTPTPSPSPRSSTGTPSRDTFEFPGYMNSYLLEQVIAPKRGLDVRNKRVVYDELERRASLIQKLARERQNRLL